ncbi:nucleotidyltransferase domain-containing protein [Candidatus Woesearchaeota archaeon]|nr:nucleotidyltransferase domain-containing protein [Candidatus Woesearchaeota archaeon]
MQLNSSGLIKHILNEYLSPLTILFGSLSKAEAKSDSDIDIAVFSPTEKKMDLSKFEKKLKRKIDLFKFKDKNDVKTSELMNSILNGFIITGGW